MLVALAFCMAIFSSCEKTEDFVINYQYEYFPTTLGHYVVYDVDSIIFDDFTGTSDTFRYQKKYVVDSLFVDLSGNDAFKLVRYHRTDSTQAWVLSDVWWGAKVNNTIEVSEENQKFVKLVFPPRSNQAWDGNKYIADSLDASWWFWRFGDWEYTITELDIPATLNGIQFDSTITVLHQADSTLIEKTVSVEKYAKHVGMIYKQFSAMEKRGDLTRPWTDPESGFILTVTINSYGN